MTPSAGTFVLLLGLSGTAHLEGQTAGAAVTCSAIECLWVAPDFELGVYNPISYTGRCADLPAMAPTVQGIFAVSLTVRCLYAPLQSSTREHWITVGSTESLFFDGFETPALRWSAVESPAS